MEEKDSGIETEICNMVQALKNIHGNFLQNFIIPTDGEITSVDETIMEEDYQHENEIWFIGELT